MKFGLYSFHYLNPAPSLVTIITISQMEDTWKGKRHCKLLSQMRKSPQNGRGEIQGAELHQLYLAFPVQEEENESKWDGKLKN